MTRSLARPGALRAVLFRYLRSTPLLAALLCLLLPSGAAAATLSIPDYSQGSYVVSWSGAPGSTFKLLERVGSSGSWTTAYSGTSKSKSFVKAYDGTYYYKVEECVPPEPGFDGYCTWSSIDSVIVQKAPGTPVFSGPNGTDLDGSYTVTWSKPTGTVTYYELWESTGVGFPSYAKVTTTSRSMTGRADGTYSYQIRACNDAGCGSYSAVKEVEVLKTPSIPQNLTGPTETSTDGNFTLTWQASEGTVDYYEIVGGWLSEESSTTSISFTGYYDGTWPFRVRACNQASCSEDSNTFTVNVLKVPTPPTNLSVPAESTSGQYYVSWRKPKDSLVDTYELDTRIDGGDWTTREVDLLELPLSERRTRNGTVSYRVRACNDTGCSDSTAEASVVVDLHVADVVPDAEVVPLAAPEHEHVGTLEGEGGVSGGKASYTIEIPVPPGIRGMAPELRLSYSSSSGNGIAGVGWSLDTGASSIYRCPRILDLHRENRPVEGEKGDSLCWRGQHLILVSGQHGEPGAEYRTEINDFAKIVLGGGDIQSEYSYFTVYLKSGLIEEYDSPHVPVGYVPPGGDPTSVRWPSSWHLTSVRDRSGNTIRYEYADDSYQKRVTRITYSEPFAPFSREIELDYHLRPVQARTYQLGREDRVTHRLGYIKSKVNGDTAYHVGLQYDESRATGRSLLRSVQIFAGDPLCVDGTCSGNALPATRFTYTDHDFSFAEEVVAGTDSAFVRTRQVNDYDGDGQRDLILLTYPEEWGGGAPTSVALRLSSDPLNDIDISNGWYTVYGDDAYYTTDRATDFDLDGKADLVGHSGGVFSMASWNEQTRAFDTISSNLPWSKGSGFVQEILDFDLDGDSDILAYHDGEYALHMNCGISSAGIDFCEDIWLGAMPSFAALASVTDFNGDGLPDLFVDWDGTPHSSFKAEIWFSHLTVGTGSTLTFEPVALESLGGPAYFSQASSRVHTRFIDVNGDGLQDIFRQECSDGEGLCPDDNSTSAHRSRFWLNHGDRFVEHSSVANHIVIHPDRAAAMINIDYDNDGIEDLLVPDYVTHNFCYLYRVSPDAESYDYCSDGSLNGPFTGSPIPHNDRGIYRYYVVRFRFDAYGTLVLERQSTELELPIFASRAADHNGDGLSDVAYSVRGLWAPAQDGEDTVKVGRYVPSLPEGDKFAVNQRMDGNGFGVDLLRQATNGLGVVERWQYSPLSGNGAPNCAYPAGEPFYTVDRSQASAGHYHFASSMTVVAEHASSDGVGGLGSTCYRYEDAMYSTNGRGFDGFKAIIVDENRGDGLDKTTRTVFHDTFPLNGRPSLSVTRLRSDWPTRTPVSRTENKWQWRLLDDGTKFVFNELERVDTYDLDTRDLTTIKRTYRRYDAGDDLNHGNVSYGYTRYDTYFEDWQRAVSNVTEHFYTYDYSRASDWWIDKLETKTTVARPTEYTSAVPGPQPDPVANNRKELVEEYQWYLDGSRLLYQRTTQRGVANEEKTETFLYDSFGNQTRVTLSAPGELARDTWAKYTDDGYYLEWRENALGHRTSFLYDPLLGKVVEETAPAGNRTHYGYDEFGQLIRTDHLDGSGPSQVVARQACGGVVDCPAHAVLVITRVSDGSPIEREYVDRLGRTLKTTTTGFQGLLEAVVTRSYDARGNLVRESAVSSDADGSYFTTYAGHDARGRPTQKTVDRSGHAHGVQTWTYAHSGITTRITLPDGVSTASRAYDAQGRLLSTTDTLGSTTHFRHDGLNNQILIEDVYGNQVAYYFDDLGRNVRIEDPDAGTSTTTYNGFGDVVTTTDGNGNEVGLVYDLLGRRTQRWVNGVLDATWEYDLQKPGTLSAVASADGGYSQTLEYDSQLRPVRSTIAIDGLEFTTETAYDAYYGRIKGIGYPSGEMIALGYDDYGYLVSEADPLGPTGDYVYYFVGERDARGNVRQASFGNGLDVTWGYFDSTGQVQSVQLTRNWTEVLLGLRYGYDDPFGNLTRREDVAKGVTEVFTYDALHRLDTASRTWSDGRPAVNVDYDYDAIGNLTLKSDYGLGYQYGDASRSTGGNAGPHAVNRVTLLDGTVLADFAYDTNGNMVSGAGRSVTYDAFNKPIDIVEGSAVSSLFYDPDLSLYKRVEPDKTVYYGGPGYQYVESASGSEERTFLSDNVVVETSAGGTERRIRYQHYDRAGSLVAVSDEQGNVVEEHFFDAFGKPLAGDWMDNGGLLHGDAGAEQLAEKGFTGHEHLDTHKLVHMGGRVYDPSLGRFLSADPIIQAPANTQSQNAYSYVMNNPLSGTDPTGYESVCMTGTNICRDYLVEGTYTTSSPSNITVTVTSDNGDERTSQSAEPGGPSVDHTVEPVTEAGGSRTSEQSQTSERSQTSTKSSTPQGTPAKPKKPAAGEQREESQHTLDSVREQVKRAVTTTSCLLNRKCHSAAVDLMVKSGLATNPGEAYSIFETWQQEAMRAASDRAMQAHRQAMRTPAFRSPPPEQFILRKSPAQIFSEQAKAYRGSIFSATGYQLARLLGADHEQALAASKIGEAIGNLAGDGTKHLLAAPPTRSGSGTYHYERPR